MIRKVLFAAGVLLGLAQGTSAQLLGDDGFMPKPESVAVTNKILWQVGSAILWQSGSAILWQ